MLIPQSDGAELDLNIYCTIKSHLKFRFFIPRSLSSYTAYLLQRFAQWITIRPDFGGRHCLAYGSLNFFKYGSSKLLLILKKYMLYYPYQWEQSARDYRELLTITNPLTDEDQTLINLFINRNERLYGKRPPDVDEFIVGPSENQKSITINRKTFFQQNKIEQLTVLHHAITQLSNCEDILIGFKCICTEGPLWLADFILNNWIDIQNEKYKKLNRPIPCVKYDINNNRLFDQLPEHVTQKILLNLTDTLDFYAMKFVCKKWHNLLQDESFWRNLYLHRFSSLPPFSKQVKSWKLFYFIRLEEKQIIGDRMYIEGLINATIQLRKLTANDILRLWEDLTHQDQPVEPTILTRINHILSNSYYYFMEDTGEFYSVKLIVIGLENPYTRTNVVLNLSTTENSYDGYIVHVEELSIECDPDTKKQRSSKFSGSDLFGFAVKLPGYSHTHSTLLTQNPSIQYPPYSVGIICCLFIMMVHPFYRTNFIKYLKVIENYCAMNNADGL
jgi:hypothetical protein